MFYLDTTTSIRYYVGTAFTYGGRQYTNEGATEDRFVALGFTKVTVQPKPDETYYTVSGPNDDGGWTSVAKSLDDVKELKIRAIKLAARAVLSVSDWYILRNFETGQAIPDGLTEFRASVRAISEVQINQVNACISMQQLEATTIVSLPTPDPQAPYAY